MKGRRTSNNNNNNNKTTWLEYYNYNTNNNNHDDETTTKRRVTVSLFTMEKVIMPREELMMTNFHGDLALWTRLTAWTQHWTRCLNYVPLTQKAKRLLCCALAMQLEQATHCMHDERTIQKCCTTTIRRWIQPYLLHTCVPYYSP